MALYRLLAGQHIQDDLSAKPDKDGKLPSKTYKEGDTFECESDLLKFNQPGAVKYELLTGGKTSRVSHMKPAPTSKNKPNVVPESETGIGGEVVADDVTEAPGEDTSEDSDKASSSHTRSASDKKDMEETLNGMSVKELKDLAKKEDIDLGEATSKKDIVKAILAS